MQISFVVLVIVAVILFLVLVFDFVIFVVLPFVTFLVTVTFITAVIFPRPTNMNYNPGVTRTVSFDPVYTLPSVVFFTSTGSNPFFCCCRNSSYFSSSFSFE